MNKIEALELIKSKTRVGDMLTRYPLREPIHDVMFRHIVSAALLDINSELTGPERYAIQRLASNGNRKSARFELRLTPDQLTRLREMAAGQTMSEFVLAKVFGGDDNE